MLLDSADAFGDQIFDHRNELFAHCYRMMGTVDEAEDALQEAFTRGWAGRDTFRRSISFRAWLFRIATNVCLNAIDSRSSTIACTRSSYPRPRRERTVDDHHTVLKQASCWARVPDASGAER